MVLYAEWTYDELSSLFILFSSLIWRFLTRSNRSSSAWISASSCRKHTILILFLHDHLCTQNLCLQSNNLSHLKQNSWPPKRCFHCFSVHFGNFHFIKCLTVTIWAYPFLDCFLFVCLFFFTTDLLQMPKAKLEDLFLLVVLSEGQSDKIWASSGNYFKLQKSW